MMRETAAGLRVLSGTLLMVLAACGGSGDRAGASADTAKAAPMAAATPVAAADFSENTDHYWGQEIELQGVIVVQQMSADIIWVELPPRSTPFPVKLSAELAAKPPSVQTRVDITGTVLEKTDSVLNAWQTAGAIKDAGQRAQMEFGTTFIEARQIRPARS